MNIYNPNKTQYRHAYNHRAIVIPPKGVVQGLNPYEAIHCLRHNPTLQEMSDDEVQKKFPDLFTSDAEEQRELRKAAIELGLPKCDVCNKYFKTKSGLAGHSIIHAEAVPN